MIKIIASRGTGKTAQMFKVAHEYGATIVCSYPPGLKYKADFVVFNDDNTYEVIDVKGFKTKEYIAKKKVFEDKFNLTIKEIN